MIIILLKSYYIFIAIFLINYNAYNAELQVFFNALEVFSSKKCKVRKLKILLNF